MAFAASRNFLADTWSTIPTDRMYLKRGRIALVLTCTQTNVSRIEAAACRLPQRGQDMSLRQEHFDYLLVRIAKPLQHVQG